MNQLLGERRNNHIRYNRNNLLRRTRNNINIPSNVSNLNYFFNMYNIHIEYYIIPY